MDAQPSYSRFLRLAKEGTWIVSGQVAAFCGSLVLVRVLTEYLSPVEYGRLALAISIALLSNQIVLGGIGGGIARYFPVATEHNDLRSYAKGSLVLATYGTIVIFVIGSTVVAGLFAVGYSELAALAIFVILLSILDNYSSILNGVQNASRRRNIVAFHSGAAPWIKIAMAVMCLRLFGVSSAVVVVGYVISSLLIVVSQIHFLRNSLQNTPQSTDSKYPWVAQIWRYSWPFSIFGLFAWLQQASDRWSLEMLGNSESVGLYVVVFQLGYVPITMALGLATTFVSPILFQRSGDAKNTARNKQAHRFGWIVALSTVALTTIVFAAAFLFHELIFRFLVASDYRKCSYLFPWVILAGGLFASGQMLALKILSELNTRRLLAPKITTAIIGVSLNIIGAATAGIDGVVFALVLSSLIYLLWIYTICLEQNW